MTTHPKGIDSDTLAEVGHYAKLFWINSGPFNHLTARKFVMRCTPTAFEDAVNTAVQNGADLGRWNKIPVAELLALVRPCFFDPNFDPSSPTRTLAPARTSSPPAPTICMSA